MSSKITIILGLLILTSVLSIGVVFYLVFANKLTAVPHTIEATNKPPTIINENREEIGHTSISPTTNKPPVQKEKAEEENTDPAKPAEIIKGIKERPSPVLEKDKFYLEEYSNKTFERIPPEKLSSEAENIRWSYRFAGSVSGIPAYASDKIYFACFDKQAYAVELKTGKITQKQKTFSQAIGSTIIHKGMYIVPQRNGYIQSFDTLTGKNIWNHRSAVHVQKDEVDISISGIRANGEDIWISKHWGNLYIIDANTGVLRADPGIYYESRINCLAVPLKNDVVYSNVAGELICYEQIGVKKIFQHTIEAGYPLSLHSDDETLFYNTTEKQLIALDPNSLKQKWKKQLNGYGYDAIQENNEILYVCAKDLYAINKKGELLWQVQAPSTNGFNRSVAFSNTALFAATEEGHVMMIDLDTGNILKHLQLNETIKNGLAFYEDVLLVSTTNKKLYAIDLW